jgi:hypothetical protein
LLYKEAGVTYEYHFIDEELVKHVIDLAYASARQGVDPFAAFCFVMTDACDRIGF